MNQPIERDIGRHDAEIDQLKNDMKDVKKDVHDIKAMLQEARGGWKTLLLLAGMSGAIGALVGKISPWLFK